MFVESGSPPLNPEAYQAYRRGMNLVDHTDNWAEAAEHFLQAWELDSLFVNAGFNAVSMLDQSFQGARGDSAFARLAALEERMTRGQRFTYDEMLALTEGDGEKQIRVLRDASEVYPLEFAYELGHALLGWNRAQEALEAFQRLEIAPGQFLERYVRSWPHYFTQYAEALHRLGHHEKELEMVLEGQRRYPGRDMAMAELKARIGLGQIQEARALMAELRRQDRWTDVYIGQREMFAHGQEEAARELLEEEVQKFETDPWYTEHRSASVRKGIVLHMLGRNVEALPLFEEYLAQNPTDLNGLGWVGITAPLAGDTARGREIEERLTEMAATAAQPAYSLIRAQIRANMGDNGGAVRYLERAFFEEGRVWNGNEHNFFDLLRLRGYPSFDELMRPRG
jgi:tetratricopeptide (TPR) repeat protein